MTSKRTGLLTLGLLLVALAAPAAGQGPPMPTPGPEHQVLKEEAGTWDAVVEVFGVPGEPKSKGVETSTIGCGGLCLINDFKGETLPGQVFHGHGTVTYDALKKKYVGSWTDSMSSGLGISRVYVGSRDAHHDGHDGESEQHDRHGGQDADVDGLQGRHARLDDVCARTGWQRGDVGADHLHPPSVALADTHP